MKCQMIFSQIDFFGHSKIHSGRSTFFIPEIRNFFRHFVLAISTSVYKKKHILMKSLTPVGQQQQPTPHPTQRNATQCNATQRNATQRNAMQCNATQCNATQRQQQRIGCSSNNNPQSLTSST
jgi:hypothetical protein